MKEIRLNGSKMVDKASTHEYLKQKLELPEYYGNNLDALWDCLSTDFSPKKIILYNCDKLKKNLGSYGSTLILLLKDVAEENEYTGVDIVRQTYTKHKPT